MVLMRSQITGPIMKVHIQEGQDVSEGDLLFTIDPRPFEALLSQALANWKRDEAQMLNARLTPGLRRSPSTSRVLSPSCASVTARFAAAVVLPSRGRALVIRITWGG